METQSKNGNYTLAIALFVVALVIIFWLKGCDGNTETIVVKHPAVVGNAKAVKPENTSVFPKDFIKENINKSDDELLNEIKKLKNASLFKDSLLVRYSVEYTKMSLDFDKMSDSLKKVTYQKAIELNAFNHTWDNDIIKLDVSGLAMGTVEQLKAKWQIKPTQQTVKVPQTVFRLLGGIETGITKDLSMFNAKANIGIQNKKGNILSISADSDQRFYIGYTASIFSIKR